MDFFDRQDSARRNTKALVIYFILGVCLLTAAVYLAVLVLFVGVRATGHRHSRFEESPRVVLWNPRLFVGVGLGTITVIALGSLFKTAELARGGSAVANLLGGRLVQPTTTNPEERKLLNVVEEMALAAGVPVPQAYVLPQEKGINAFAAGHSTSDAVVAVTGGALRLLTRDELQGVIGHEFSHILNGDMRLNLRLMGAIFGIICLAVVGRILLQVRGGRDRNALPLLGLALLVIGWAGVFFGRLIQAAVSRQREFLADASAVQFTRNPAGLASALKKIGGLSHGSQLQAPHAEEASHMYFSRGVGESFFHLLNTHPPLVERIKALEPSFDGKFTRVSDLVEEAATPPKAAPAWRRAAPLPFPFPGARGIPGLPPLVAPPVIAAASAFSKAGGFTTEHLQYAGQFREALPTSLESALREPLGASTVIYALLLSTEEPTRNQQCEELKRAGSAAIHDETVRIWPAVQTVATHAKLPLIDLALPALRELSATQFTQFQNVLKALIESDGHIDLFEYVLQKIVLRHLEPTFSGARKPIIQYYSFAPLGGDCALLLSALAYVGQKDDAKVRLAFQQGALSLRRVARLQATLLPETSCGLSAVDRSLDRLAQAVPQIKKNVLQACAETVAADGLIEEEEAELLRAVSDTLDCPLPPFIPSLRANL